MSKSDEEAHVLGLEPTREEPTDIVLVSPTGVLSVKIPNRSGWEGWEIVYCGEEYSSTQCLFGTFPYFLEFIFPRKDGGVDVFPFDRSNNTFGEPRSIGPSLPLRLKNLITNRRFVMSLVLAAFIYGVVDITCDGGKEEEDSQDVSFGPEDDMVG